MFSLFFTQKLLQLCRGLVALGGDISRGMKTLQYVLYWFPTLLSRGEDLMVDFYSKIISISGALTTKWCYLKHILRLYVFFILKIMI